MAFISTQTSSASFLSSSSSSSSLIPQWKYDVFLSFRGEDTRKNFTDHLHAALKQNGIYTFKDDQEIEKGKDIDPELLKAIEESEISIIIFSRTYASSKWCLDELVKIVESKNNMRQKVVPVFYDVDPSEVRNQTGHFKEAFAEHEKVFRENLEKVQRWRAAMREVGNLCGYHLKDRHESEFIQDIVKDISSKLNPTKLSVVEGLVGIYSRLEKLMSLHARIGLDNVGMIGIYGMGGIGKTTIARVFYKQMSSQFEGSSFLANVREVSERGDFFHLQKQLLSQIIMGRDVNIYDAYDGIDMIRRRLCHKRVLVIIDDVNQLDQLKVLAGKHDWFGSGSRIIITTRDRSLLVRHGVNEVYGVDGLNHDEALHLFSLKAFTNHHPPEDFVRLSSHFVNYASGLPLALEVLGSFLFDKGVHEWKSALNRLREYPEEKIFNVLQLSFNGLKQNEKEIFLHVACFFKGKNKDHVMRILDSCGFHAEIGIRVLIDKTLIIMVHNTLQMHDLLQDLGSKIVQQESLREPGERSRLWLYDDVYHVFTKDKGTKNVGAMVLDLPELKGAQLSAKAFSKLDKLRLLILRDVHISYGLEYLSNELRFLKWHGYPFRNMPSSFQPDDLVELNMCYSHIEQLWKGIKPLNKLKIIKLSHSQRFIKTPDFREVPNLEKLILEGCSKLSEVDQSIGVLKRLILLNLKDCKNLLSLPSSIHGLKSLKTLSLSGCSKLENIPGNLGCLECLEELDVSGTAMRQPPSSIFYLKNLKELSFSGCKGPPSKLWHSVFHSWLMQRQRPDLMGLLLPSLSGLASLTYLNLRDCNLLEGAIPNDIGCLSSLRALILSGNNFVSLPSSINQLLNLKVLFLDNCKRLQSLLELPSKAVVVNADACSSLKTLSDSFDGSFAGFRCLQLMKNQDYNSMAFTIMKRCFQGMSDQSNPKREEKKDYPLAKEDRFDIVLPGGEILEWFSHQSEGSSISIERVPLLHNSKNRKLMGFALCCVFVVNEHPPAREYDGTSHCTSYTHGLYCAIKVNGVLNPASGQPAFTFNNKSGQAVSDHLFLLYLSLHSGYYFYREGQDYSHIEFTYKTRGPGLEVKKCGVRPVYEHDVEEFHQTKDYTCTSSFLEKFNDQHHGFEESAMNGAMIKRIRDDCEGAESTGNDSFDDDSQPKRLKITPNVFDGGHIQLIPPR